MGRWISNKNLSNELLLSVRWLVSAALIAASAVMWASSAKQGWHLLTLRQQIQDQESQEQRLEELLTNSRFKSQTSSSALDLQQAPPVERLLQEVARTPGSITVYINELSAPGDVKVVPGRTRIHLIGDPSRIARFVQHMERGNACLLVTGVTVQPGTSRDNPSSWTVDGILP